MFYLLLEVAMNMVIAFGSPYFASRILLQLNACIDLLRPLEQLLPMHLHENVEMLVFYWQCPP